VGVGQTAVRENKRRVFILGKMRPELGIPDCHVFCDVAVAGLSRWWETWCRQQCIFWVDKGALKAQTDAEGE